MKSARELDLDTKPVVLGAVWHQKKKNEEKLPVLTGTSSVLGPWEQCDPGDPCGTKAE